MLENKPKNLPADQRRAVTVEAVIELAAEQNPSEITTAAIANRMNLTQGALFRHFPSKEAIWQAVMEWVAEHLLARVDRAIAAEKSPLLALESVFMTHIDFVASHPGVPRMLFGQLQHSEDTAPKRMARTLIGRYAERLPLARMFKICAPFVVMDHKRLIVSDYRSGGGVAVALHAFPHQCPHTGRG